MVQSLSTWPNLDSLWILFTQGCFVSLFRRKGSCLPLNQTWRSFTKEFFVLKLVECYPSGSRIFFNFVNVNSVNPIISPWKIDCGKVYIRSSLRTLYSFVLLPCSQIECKFIWSLTSISSRRLTLKLVSTRVNPPTSTGGSCFNSLDRNSTYKELPVIYFLVSYLNSRLYQV